MHYDFITDPNQLMLDELYQLSQHFLKTYQKPYQRYFLQKHKLENRFSIITGQRGIGKSTSLIQYLLSKHDLFDPKILYIQADHFLVGKRSLYEITEEFYTNGGKIICFDEIHKYPDWSMELKSIYDTFTKLKILASGSSALEIHKGSHDLSRRAILYAMHGMSFREFLELQLNIRLKPAPLKSILKNHLRLTKQIIETIEQLNKKILPLFKDYLQRGYYPYFSELKNKTLFYTTLEQNIHTTLEADLPAIYPTLTGTSIQKMKRLLTFIAGSVPFTPDLIKLKLLLEIGDERTLKTYFKYLEDAGIILQINKQHAKLSAMAKPGKLYLNNTCQTLALNTNSRDNNGALRETFFASMLTPHHKLAIPTKSDFIVDGEFYFEIGGKKKGFEQIKDLKNAYLAVDDIEHGIKNKIPLWLFGFLY